MINIVQKCTIAACLRAISCAGFTVCSYTERNLFILARYNKTIESEMDIFRYSLFLFLSCKKTRILSLTFSTSFTPFFFQNSKMRRQLRPVQARGCRCFLQYFPVHWRRNAKKRIQTEPAIWSNCAYGCIITLYVRSCSGVQAKCNQIMQNRQTGAWGGDPPERMIYL